MLPDTIKLKITSLWDKVWTQGRTDRQDAIQQISYLLLSKWLDASHTYEGYFVHKEECRWSTFTKQDREKMHEVYHASVLSFLEGFMRNISGHEHTVRGSMDVHTTAEAIQLVDEIYSEITAGGANANRSFQFTLGDVYEYLISEMGSTQLTGAFITPRHIVQLMVALIAPKPGERLCDPACGTGGFLLGALNYMETRQAGADNKIKNADGFERFIELNSDSIRRQDFAEPLGSKLQGFDFSVNMQFIGLINLLLNEVKEPVIELANTLSPDFDEKYSDRKYDVIISNPSWGGRTKDLHISGMLADGGTDSGQLFIKRALLMLKPGGRAAMIVPEGILQNRSQQQWRRELLRMCRLDAVISLPVTALLPFSSAKTSIIMFTKPEHVDPDLQTENVWFYELKGDGYSVGRDRRKLSDNPLPQAVEAYEHRLETPGGQSNGFSVSMAEILHNECDLGYHRYSPPEFEELYFPPTHEIIHALINLESDIQKDLKDLQQSLT